MNVPTLFSNLGPYKYKCSHCDLERLTGSHLSQGTQKEAKLRTQAMRGRDRTVLGPGEERNGSDTHSKKKKKS